MRNNTPRSNTKQPTKEELENALLRSSGTQGRAKLEQYFLEIVRTQEFQDAVRELRSCYDIPEIGFNTEERIYPPAAWKHRRAGAKIQMIGQEIDKLSEEYGLTPMYWGITKDTYDRKHQEYADKLQLLEIELSEHREADHGYQTTVATVISVARRAKAIFESSEPNEKRTFLNYLLQNPSVKEKKLCFTIASPFNLVLELADSPNWLRG